MSVLLQCPLGEIVVDLFCEEGCRALCENFLKLCKAKFYTGCLFYNVQHRPAPNLISLLNFESG